MTLALVGEAQSNLNQDALNEFIEYRAEDLKKEMSPRAISKARNFLLKYHPVHQQHLVDHAIMLEWRGLYHVDMPKVPCGTSSRDVDIMDDLTDRSWAK